VYQGQKVHLFRSSLGFLAEAQSRHENSRGRRHFLAHMKFLGDRTNDKTKDIIGKITNLFCIYLFQIDKFINKYVLTIFVVFVIRMPTKLEIYYLQYNYVLIYIIYGGRTIVGFVGFVANLLNRPTDGASVKIRKRVTFRPLVST
jgi:hypothetical protein